MGMVGWERRQRGEGAGHLPESGGAKSQRELEWLAASRAVGTGSANHFLCEAARGTGQGLELNSNYDPFR